MLFTVSAVLVQLLLLSDAAGQGPCTTFSQGDGECVSLQVALDQLADWENLGLSDCVEVELGAGLHVISRAVEIKGIQGHNTSLSFRGEENASTVAIECASSVTLELNHAIYLGSLETLTFEGVAVYNCVRPIRVANTRRVSFRWSTFRFFSSGAVDVFNCIEVTFDSVVFADNQAIWPITDTAFRSNAGGASVGIDNIPFTNSSSPAIYVLNCTFLRNKANPPPQGVVSTSQLLQGFIFVGRGGGLGIFVQESLQVKAIVRNCIFDGNFATNFGGGLYVIMDGSVSNHSVNVSGSQFINNAVNIGGGGLYTTYTNSTDVVHSVITSNCTFTGNSAMFGGGGYVIPAADTSRAYAVTYRNCTFQGNTAEEYGAALGLYTLNIFESREGIKLYTIEDCTFEDNYGSRAGTLSAAYSPVLMTGHNSFTNNTGPALRILATTLTIHGSLDFIGNDAENSDGGALYVTSYGQVLLKEGAEMNFNGNRGNLGSAIVVEAQIVGTVFAQTAFNRQCFLRYGPDPNLSPELWNNVSLTFSGNTAVIGPVAYINQLELCSWYQLAPPYFDKARVLRWPFVDLSNDNFNTGHRKAERNDSSRYIQTPAVFLQVLSNITGYPGQVMGIEVRTLDELWTPTASVIRLNDLTVLNDKQVFRFEPSLLAHVPQSIHEVSSFSVSTNGFVVTDDNVSLSIYSYTPEAASIIETTSFSAHFCLPGYSLKVESSGEFSTCQCITVNNPFLLECEFDKLIISPNIWSTVHTNSDGTLSLRSYHCPVDYCRPIHNTSFGDETYASVFQHSFPDHQCSCNRTGVLCGSCPHGHGVSALFNHCVHCSNGYSMLLLILVLVDVAIFIAIIAVSKPLSAWLYPCIFYIQILPLITNEFPITFRKVQGVLYYLSSALAFYFPYDFCLYKAMSPLVSYSFRYIPLLVASVTVSGVVYIRRKFRPAPWHGVWMVVLLLYPHMVHTSLSILSCPDLSPYGSRWYIDGSIECFAGGHAAVGVFAILVVILAALAVPLVVLVSFNLIKNPRWERSIVEPLVYAYREKFHWCVGAELGRRFVVLLFTIAFPGSPIVPAFVLIITTSFYLFVQPYSSRLANIVEALLAISTIILFFLASNAAVSEGLVVNESSQLNSVSYNEDNCPSPVSGVTTLTKVMTPFYYLPLIVLLIGMAVTVVVHVRRRWKSYHVNADAAHYVKYELGDVEMKVDTFTHTSVTVL